MASHTKMFSGTRKRTEHDVSDMVEVAVRQSVRPFDGGGSLEKERRWVHATVVVLL